MSTADVMNEHWVDIVPPLAPPATPDLLSITLGGIFLLVVAGLAVMLYRRPRVRARRAIRRLGRELHQADIENQPACMQIRHWLRRGLRQSQLQAVEWPPEYQAAWLAYVDRLARGCFAPAPPSIAEMKHLIDEALGWLDRKTVAR